MKKNYYYFLFFIFTFTSYAQYVSTYAGANETGFLDGFTTGTVQSKFNKPRGVAVDAFGNVYIADTDNHRIRKITPTGVVTTLAGSFNNPKGVAVDVNGNVYVADELNHVIRKITSTGVVTTVAGSTIGFAEGTGSSAKFCYPNGIVANVDGNLYVADSGNNRIRKITPTGVVTTLAGTSIPGNVDGASTIAQFYFPIGIDIDAFGNLYVADSQNHRIRKITPTGVVTTLAGSTIGLADGTGSLAKFNNPKGVAVDLNGNVYVADEANHKIRKITSTGVVTSIAGNGFAGDIDDQGDRARLNLPFGIAFDENGNFYVGDTENNKIKKVTSAGDVSNYAGDTSGYVDGTSAIAKIYISGLTNIGITIDAQGTVYFTDSSNFKIRKISPSGIVSTIAGSGIRGESNGIRSKASFDYPCGIVLDSFGNLFVTEGNGNKVRKITPDGVVTTFAGSISDFGGSTDGIGTSALFNRPTGLAIDSGNNIYVADSGNNRIRKITPTGVVTTLAGSTQGFVNGTGSSAKFNNPRGVAVDLNGNLYVSDTGNHSIRKITSTGVVTTLAGSGTQGYVDGMGNVAQFYSPQGLTLDTNGNIFVADSFNRRIRIITPSLIVSTYAGGFSVGGSVIDGPLLDARFGNVLGIATAVNGDMYITHSNHVRKISVGALGFDQNDFQKNTLKLYPNPTKDILNVEVDEFSTFAVIYIVDIMGKIIYNQKIESYLTTISTNFFNKGMYFLTITDGSKKITKKFVVN